jgi:hypothetical protein
VHSNNSSKIKVSLPKSRLLEKHQIICLQAYKNQFLELCSDKKYVCKYIKISNWSYAQIIFPTGFADQGALNKDPTVCLDGDHPQKYVCKYKKYNLKSQSISQIFNKKVSLINVHQWKNTFYQNI